MPEISEKVRKELLEFARLTIKARLENLEILPELSGDEFYCEKRGCFVTLHKNGELRGCIGIIEPVYPLAEAIGMNALNAAFDDSRFFPLEACELDHVCIEISVLSVPEKLEYNGSEDLLKKLQPLRHGVIISRNSRKATFLPQVWEQLPEPVHFLKNLCLKAGLSAFSWKESDFRVQVYEAEVFSEKC